MFQKTNETSFFFMLLSDSYEPVIKELQGWMLNRVARAGIIAQLVKPLLYKLKNMCVGPRIHVTVPGMVAHTCNPRAGE